MKRCGIGLQLWRQRDGGRQDYNGTPSPTKLFGQVAQGAADSVVFTVTYEVFEQQDCVTLYEGDIGQGLLGLIGAVDRSTWDFRKPGGQAPGVERYAEFGGNGEQQSLKSFLFRRFDSEDRI